jgi:RNA polymerase sigma-70 factor, ECF subfamily
MRAWPSTLTTAVTFAGSKLEEGVLQQRVAMDRFLAGVQRRAFRMAQLAVRNPDDALDIVQDAMLKLVRTYSKSPAEEWPLLFFRILRNCALDHHRRQSVRRRLFGWLPGTTDAEDAEDVLSNVPGRESDGPDHQVAMGDAMSELERAVAELPARQRETFLLRTLEGLDVAATAAVMGCSQGSVKTHMSRAIDSLRERLGPHWAENEHD